MDGAAVVNGGYRPPPEFVEHTKEPLVDIDLTDSTELWLIQWPNNHPPDFDGSELTVKLHHDGKLGSFEGSSGKEYDMVSFAAQEPNATVFLSSSSGSKIVGKISRRVSIVHYPQPTELEKLNPANLKLLYQRSAGTSSHYLTTPSQSTKMKSLQSASKYTTSTHSSRQKSGISSDAGESSKPSKEKGKRVHESTGSMGHHSRESGHVQSAVTSFEHSRGYSSAVSSGSMGNSSQKSPRKKKKIEE